MRQVLYKAAFILLLFISCIVHVKAQQAENTFVLIFSNESYWNEQPVQYALKDGESFQKCCEETLGIPSENILFVKNATFNQIRVNLSWLNDVMQKYEGKARAIVYYSGHGMPCEDGKHSYLLPVDGDSKVPLSGYSTEELYSQLAKMRSAGTLLILDACFSGTRRDGKMLAASRGVAIKAKGTPIRGNVVVFSACSGDETAYPYQEKQQGLFTYYLLNRLQSSYATKTLGAICDDVIKEVSLKSLIINKKSQTPTVSASLEAPNWRNWIYASNSKEANREINNTLTDEGIQELKKDFSNLEERFFTAWYCYGTKTELIKNKIIDGFIQNDSVGVRSIVRSFKPTNDYNKEYFTKVDIRNCKEIKFYSRSAKILTTHPNNSYTLMPDSNRRYVLKIISPEDFWSFSKYLVVLVK